MRRLYPNPEKEHLSGDWVKFRLGLGNYLRNATEHLLFATRGKAPVRFRSQPTWIQAPVQDHSHKPEEQYALIERISPGPYLELFARRRPPRTPGQPPWAVWGNQIDSDIRIPGYPVPAHAHHAAGSPDRAAANQVPTEHPHTTKLKGGTP